jgi:hypothetical protein
VIALILLAVRLLAAPLKSKRRLEAENAALRHQLIVLRRKVHGGVQLSNADRLCLVQLTWGGSLSSVIYGAICDIVPGWWIRGSARSQYAIRDRINSLQSPSTRIESLSLVSADPQADNCRPLRSQIRSGVIPTEADHKSGKKTRRATKSNASLAQYPRRDS